MNKEQILQQFKQLLDSLPEPKPEEPTVGAHGVFVPGLYDEYWCIYCDLNSGRYNINYRLASEAKMSYGFKTPEATARFTARLNLFMKMAVAPGARDFKPGEDNWQLYYNTREGIIDIHRSIAAYQLLGVYAENEEHATALYDSLTPEEKELFKP